MNWRIIIILTLLSLAGCSRPNTEEPVEVGGTQQQHIIVVHGLARSAWSMKTMASIFKEQHYQVCVVDYPTIRQTLQHTLDSSANELTRCINDWYPDYPEEEQQGKIHFVGHSLGGLVIRDYLDKHTDFVDSELMGRVVLLGTPNHGSDVADFFSGSWLISLVGGTAESLTTDDASFPNSLPEPNYAFGVIAGTRTYPALSGMFEATNDGLVSVSSAQLQGMTDFIEVNVKHDRLRRDPHVAGLILNYFRTGTFTPDRFSEQKTQ
ncbi:alpha/beta fold hydrolase [Vibrio hippocampi]|uniref:Lipase n=1 Tax=Vibrio hippocampi TaxID=654686 RepID=A0ABM8ZP60_9VIBR|nr:alpha/beta fold hydrolase [Vibrio hippocampi]CAH0530259.1 hypothetical protein VHP8226_03926 [Vibrio hippocampi]